MNTLETPRKNKIEFSTTTLVAICNDKYNSNMRYKIHNHNPNRHTALPVRSMIKSRKWHRVICEYERREEDRAEKKQQQQPQCNLSTNHNNNNKYVKGYFDRINHTFAILVRMSFGVSAVLAQSLFETLQKANHHIKTGYSRSDKAYGNNNEPEPHQGIGQGNGLGPTLWALLSSILIKNMKRHNHGRGKPTQRNDTLAGEHSMLCICRRHRPSILRKIPSLGRRKNM
jgi:hypothetical protein